MTFQELFAAIISSEEIETTWRKVRCINMQETNFNAMGKEVLKMMQPVIIQSFEDEFEIPDGPQLVTPAVP